MSAARTCPWCGAEEGSLFIAVIWVAVAVGEFSLAGQAMKAPMYQAPVLVCRACRKETVGLFDEDGSGCRFDPAAEPSELTSEQLASREAQLVREALKEPSCATDPTDSAEPSPTGSTA